MSEIDWMRRALALAAQARGRTAPNPMVGAVIVRDGAVLAEGWHRAPGQPHAEVDALSKLGSRADGATMYVNLEPCCHHGRTPPCTDAIIASGVCRVVVGMVDPDDRVRGAGIEQLRRAGLTVDVGLEADACEALNRSYLLAKRHGRPSITLKAGATLDGRIASATGESKWISGEASRAAGHALRDTHDAILVGSGTVLGDDPSLNARGEGGRDPLPVLLDTSLRCPADARVLHAGRRPVIFCAQDAPQRVLDADVVRVPRVSGRVDLDAVLDELLRRGIHSVLVEGGGRVHRSFIDADYVDRIELYLAPKLLVGGPGWLGGAPFALADAPQLRVVGVELLGGDVHISLER